jgi:hypothetical protein
MWNGTKLNTGHGNDQFLTAIPNGPMKATTIGADGSMTVSKLADTGGVITMTFMQTAKALGDIDIIAAAEMAVQEAFNLPFAGFFTFEDPTGNSKNFVAYNTVLVDRGEESHQKEVGERTITWHCEKLIPGDPASIMREISTFIKD